MTRSIPMARRGRRVDRVRAERRGAAARAGLSGAAVAARRRGQRQRQVAAPHRAGRSAVHDARGDVEVHRSAARRHGADVQPRDGREVAHHRARVPRSADGPGWWEIRGIAWSGRGKITRVEVSTDGGKTWQHATLDEPVLPKCHTRFRLPWEWKGGEAVLMSRATDETGYVQPTLRRVDGGARTVHRSITSTTSARGMSPPTAP